MIFVTITQTLDENLLNLNREQLDQLTDAEIITMLQDHLQFLLDGACWSVERYP